MKEKETNRKCEFCMRPLLYEFDRGEKKRYCNSECRRRAEHSRKVERAKTKQCDECGVDFKALYKTSRFCSRQCSTIWFNKNRKKKADNTDINKMIFMFGG